MLKNTSSSMSFATKLDVSCYFCAVPPNHAGSSKSGLSSLGLCGFGVPASSATCRLGSHYAAGGTEQGSTSCVTELSLKELIRPADGETEALSSPCCFPSHHCLLMFLY
ncbi:hypothetical protein I7I53_10859 [Histoplasma capsulatum var. duboisii H88]|uniref:Uncharacterized protein n=1 Tax=Ajellomyces capsulatus (strain H88) TaxID=544711 RepID=A0A8A1L9D7_AJEC8|nr:hypothetical protein I7I53_10859 [Histoplasma capsulatum var. duboisii H88]